MLNATFPAATRRSTEGSTTSAAVIPSATRTVTNPAAATTTAKTTRYQHDCPTPECGLFPVDGGASCDLAEVHELPHRNGDDEFVTVERPLLTVLAGMTVEF